MQMNKKLAKSLYKPKSSGTLKELKKLEKIHLMEYGVTKEELAAIFFYIRECPYRVTVPNEGGAITEEINKFLKENHIQNVNVDDEMKYEMTQGKYCYMPSFQSTYRFSDVTEAVAFKMRFAE